ncbi:Threonine/homoserine/homoserine lactone efflux protein [Rhodoferax sp. OV413]|uniref:LysE family translocator n=1 Tax=Rhodoferax sp. OV413 TaxID=1855285 RepID=UPI00088DC6DC|nr:LysE family translocator [Rhodoferax sp. OV413]SDO81257.1 Threonine/homoserine/homoserine lactone efflux protein [Rhodoferax sp. OV413]
MTHYTHLWLFFVMVLGIIVLPGMDMAFVLSNALVGGRKSGLYAVAGMVAGGICHVVAGVLGLGLVLRWVPGLLNALLLLGAVYIAWIGVSVLRSQSAIGPLPAVGTPPPGVIFRRAMLTCLMNPKAYLFMLAIFPQFLRVEYGAVWVQAVVLGLIIALTQTVVYGFWAVAAGGSRAWLAARPQASIAMGRLVGGVLVLGAVWTAVQGWNAV